MHPPRFYYQNCNPRQSLWRPQGPRFGPRWPVQYGNHPNSREHNFSNNNEEHWCETCDRGFRTIELLLNHKQQHQKCNIDGCQFIAHPKVITKHIQMQHSTGLYKKISKLDNPEEIQKWREERKKRYPTKENIEKRTAEIKEKIERGEKMGMGNHRENKYNGRGPGIKRKGSQDINRKNFKKKFQMNKSSTDVSNRNITHDNNKPSKPQKENKLVPQVNDFRTLKPFTGILNLLDDNINDDDSREMEIVDSIEDDEYIEMEESRDKNDSINTEPVVCGALSSLICNYESSDEESVQNTHLQENKSENFKSNNISKENASVKQNESLKNNTDAAKHTEDCDDDSGPEETKIEKSHNTESRTDMPSTSNRDSNNQNPERREKHDKIRCNTKMPPNKFKSKLPSTLLEKLLRNEIRQERNIVLQCIRYIVRNNYFDKV